MLLIFFTFFRIIFFFFLNSANKNKNILLANAANFLLLSTIFLFTFLDFFDFNFFSFLTGSGNIGIRQHLTYSIFHIFRYFRFLSQSVMGGRVNKFSPSSPGKAHTHLVLAYSFIHSLHTCEVVNGWVLADYAALSATTTQASYRNSRRPLKAGKLPVNMDVKNVLSIYLS